MCGMWPYTMLCRVLRMMLSMVLCTVLCVARCCMHGALHTMMQLCRISPHRVFCWRSKVQPSEANYKQSRAEMSQIAGYLGPAVPLSRALWVQTFQLPQITKRGPGTTALPSAEGPSPPQPQAKTAS